MEDEAVRTLLFSIRLGRIRSFLWNIASSAEYETSTYIIPYTCRGVMIGVMFVETQFRHGRQVTEALTHNKSVTLTLQCALLEW